MTTTAITAFVRVLIPQGLVRRFPSTDKNLHACLTAARPDIDVPRHLLLREETGVVVRLSHEETVQLLNTVRTLGLQWHWGGDPDGVRYAVKAIRSLNAALLNLRALTP